MQTSASHLERKIQLKNKVGSCARKGKVDMQEVSSRSNFTGARKPTIAIEVVFFKCCLEL